MLSELILQREKFSEYVQSHRSIISLSRRLPREIYQEIFFKCLPSGRDAVLSAREAPLILGRVCRFWREIVYSTPSLWSYIHLPIIHKPILAPNHSGLDFQDDFEQKWSQRLEVLQDWIGRSGGIPLSVSIADDHGSPFVPPNNHDRSEPIEPFAAAYQILLPEKRRWRTVNIAASDAQISTIAALSADDVPRLEALQLMFSPRVHFGDVSIDVVDQWPWRKAGTFRAPALRRLGFIFNDIKYFDVTGLPVAWSQLTELYIENNSYLSDAGLTSQGAFFILKSCTQLAHFHIRISRPAFEGEFSDDPKVLSHPHLISFFIESIMDYGLEDLFVRLELPSLKKLELHEYGPATHTSYSAFKTILSRCGTELDVIYYSGAMLFHAPSALIESLRLVPSIRELHLCNFSSTALTYNRPNNRIAGLCLTDDFMQHFIPSTPSEHILCPKLELFHCHSETSQLLDQALLDFVLARTRSAHKDVSSLKDVKVVFKLAHRNQEADIVKRLKSLRPEVKVEVLYLAVPVGKRGLYSLWSGLNFGAEDNV